MAENFQDNISYGGSTLAVSGDAVAIGSTNAGAKSVIFNNTGSQGHLAWQPTANRTINLPDAGGTIQLTGQVPAGIQAGTQTATSGTAIFSNSNGISFGMSNSSVITASYTVPSTAGLISNVNISAGTTSNNLTNFVFSNSNNVSFGLNGSTVTATITVPTQTNQTVGLYALGNTTQNSSTTLDARTLSFNGLGAATVGYSNGSIQVSVPTQTAQTQSNIAGVFDGANSISTGTIRFTNANGVSFSINGQTISGSVAAQTNQTVGLYAVSNTTGASSSSTFDARSISFQGAGVASVGYTNGSVVISVPSGGAGNVNISAGTTSNNLTNFVFSNSNNVSFGLNGSTVTATITVPSQTNQTVGLYALGNTTQNSSTTLDARTLSFNGLGIVTAGYSNGSIQISATQSAQTAGLYAVGNTTQNSSTTLDARTLSFNGLGAASVGYSNGSIQISVPGNTLVFSNSNNISFGSAGGTTITASYSPGTISNYTLFPDGAITSTQQANASMSFKFFSLDRYVTLTQLAVPFIISVNTGANTTVGSLAFTSGAGIYSRSGSTLSPVIGSLGSNTQTWSSNATASIQGVRNATFGIATLLSPGEYWMGIYLSTASTNFSNAISALVGSQYTGSNFAEFGAATNNSLGYVLMQGLCATVVTATSQTFQQSQITIAGVQGMQGNLPLILRNT